MQGEAPAVIRLTSLILTDVQWPWGPERGAVAGTPFRYSLNSELAHHISKYQGYVQSMRKLESQYLFGFLTWVLSYWANRHFMKGEAQVVMRLTSSILTDVQWPRKPFR